MIKLLAAVVLVSLPGMAYSAKFLGPGASEGRLGDSAEMNRICRETYAEEEADHGNVRWASTTDYLEASNRQGWGGHEGHEYGLDRVALRAERTVFTPDGRAYDEATGALSPRNEPRFPAAVIMTQQNAWFGRRSSVVAPLCVHGLSSTSQDP